MRIDRNGWFAVCIHCSTNWRFCCTHLDIFHLHALFKCSFSWNHIRINEQTSEKNRHHHHHYYYHWIYATLRYAMLYAYVEFSAAKFNFNKWSGRPYSAVCERYSCVCACIFALPLPNMSELCVPVMCYFYTQTATNTHIGPTDYYLFQLSHYSSFRPGVMRAAITAAAAAFAAENFLSLFDQCYVRRMIWPVLVNVNCHSARFFRFLFFFSFPL